MKLDESRFYGRVWKTMRRIPRGKVTTYGELAKALRTKAYRAVGNACRHNPYAPEVPCHRVVANGGRIGGFGGQTKGRNIRQKIAMLKKEGVSVKDGRVADFDRFLFRFK
jgi:methylated-DNA-[protein]-cysteine S-methyltransferase